MATVSFDPLSRYLRTLCPESDAAILARFARSGDEDAFAELVRRHGPAVLGVCRRVLRDGHAAEDAFQATFLLLAKKAGSLARPERLGCWLHGVARRTSLKLRGNILRRLMREQPFDESAFVQADDSDAELGPAIDAAIEQLPWKYRLPVVLCYLQGLTNAEAAAAMGCPANTVATRLARARQRLRGRLAKQGLTAGVSAALVAATAHSAAAMVAGTAGPSIEILTLMEGVRSAMMWKKAKFLAVTVMILTLAGLGAGGFGFRAAADQPTPGSHTPKVEPSCGVSAPPTAVNSPDMNHVATKSAQVEMQLIVLAGPANMLEHDEVKARLPKPKAGDSGPVIFRVMASEEASLLVRACVTTSGAKILAEPRIVTQSGRSALFHTGREQPIPTKSGGALRKVGLEVRLLPVVKNNGRIYLETTPTLSTVNEATGTQTEYGFVPGFNEQSMRTAAEVQSGETVMIRMESANGGESRTTLIFITSHLVEAGPVVIVQPPSNSEQMPPPVVAPTLPPGFSSPSLQLPPPINAASNAGSLSLPTTASSGLVVIQVSLDKEGMVVCKFAKTTIHEPVTTLLPDESVPVTSFRRRSIQEEYAYRPIQLRIIGSDGKPVDAKDLAKRLEKEATALFVSDGRDYSQLLPVLKEGTLLIAPARYTGVPTAPPPKVPDPTPRTP